MEEVGDSEKKEGSRYSFTSESAISKSSSLSKLSKI